MTIRATTTLLKVELNMDMEFMRIYITTKCITNESAIYYVDVIIYQIIYFTIFMINLYTHTCRNTK